MSAKLDLYTVKFTKMFLVAAAVLLWFLQYVSWFSVKFHQEKVGKLCCRLTNSLQFPPVACTYTLQVHAHTYRNTYHLISDAYCCEHYSWTNCLQSGWCTTTTCKCDNRFNFCVRNYGTGQDNNANNCPLGSKRTGLVYSDNDYFNFSSSMGGVSNPMSFTGSSWPVSIPPVFDHLCIQVPQFVGGGGGWLSECIPTRTVRHPLDGDSLASPQHARIWLRETIPERDNFFGTTFARLSFPCYIPRI